MFGSDNCVTQNITNFVQTIKQNLYAFYLKKIKALKYTILNII